MNDQFIDEQLQRFSSAMAHASGDPLPIVKQVPQRRPKRPMVVAVSAFAGVMLTLGLGAVVASAVRSTDSTNVPLAAAVESWDDADAYWSWLTEDAVELGADAVGTTQMGPEPNFDLSSLGKIQQLVPFEESDVVPFPTFFEPAPNPPVAHVGTIEGTTSRVLIYRPSDADAVASLCLMDIQPNATLGVAEGGISCAGLDSAHLTDGFVWSMGVVSHDERGGLVHSVSMAMLPRSTAAVVFDFPDGRSIVQRPVGGVAAIQADVAGFMTPLTVELLDVNGGIIARETLTLPSDLTLLSDE